MPDGEAYAHCPFCESEAFVDLTGAVLYQVIKPSIGHSRAGRLIGSQARDAGWPDLRIADLELVYEPVWELELSEGRRLRIGARPASDGRFGVVDLPGGEREFIHPDRRDGSANWLEPELVPESLAEVAARAIGRPVSLQTVRLIHRPIYSGHCLLAGERYEVRLDAVSGELIAAEWPSQPTFGSRNMAWAATILMVLGAAIIPLPWSPIAVGAVGAFAFISLSRGPRLTPAEREA